MLNVKSLVFDNDGRLVGVSGTFSRTVFSVITDKVIFWAEFGLEYAGG